MAMLESKTLTAPQASDSVARAKLFHHLAYKGWMALETDAQGPVRVLVNGMALQEWERIAKDKGDYEMRLVSMRDWKYEK